MRHLGTAPVLVALAWLVCAWPSNAAAQQASPMTRAQFDALFQQVDNAGRWGDRDERGTLNLITPEVRRAAVAGVRRGITVSLTRESAPDAAGAFEPMKVERLVASDSILGPSDGSVTWAVERTTQVYHGWAFTHLDALSHMPSYRGRGYNNAPPVLEPGAEQLRNSVAAMREGVVSRGVLVDLPRLRRVEYVQPGQTITVADLEAWEKQAGLKVRAGDVLLLRSGRWSGAAIAAGVKGSAGLHPSAAAWLHARGVAAVGDEGGTDLAQSVVAGINSPFHVLALVAMGMPLFENLDLERLAGEAAAQSSWSFLFMAAPLHVRGATGSAINPVVVF